MSDNVMLRNQAVTSIPVTDQNISAFVSLLKDPVLSIRTRSAFKLSSYESYIPSEAMSDYELARKEYIDSQNYNYDFPQTKMNLAILEYNKGDLKEAEHFLLAVQKQDKLFLDAYVYLAYIYNQMGEREKAVGQFKTYLKFNPYDSQRLYELALLYAEMKQYKEAIANLEKALSYEPNNPSFMLNLAKLYEIDRHLNKAESVFIQIIDRNAKEQAYYTEFINFYRRTNQQAKAQTLTTEMYRRFGVTR